MTMTKEEVSYIALKYRERIILLEKVIGGLVFLLLLSLACIVYSLT
jgi:hypothetical protein